MTRQQLEHALRALPPEEASSLLRDLLERQSMDVPPADDWLGTIDRIIAQRLTLMRRLAAR